MSTIHLIDDSATMLMSMEMLLKRAGYTVTKSNSAEAAIKDLQEITPKLIITDLNMPGMNGYEFLKIVKKNPEWQDIKIMMVTSENQQESVLEALNAGADEYLMKPFDQKMLLTKIEMIMEDV